MDINSILAADLSLDQKFSISMTTLLTGFVVVFAVLILLIVVIAVYGKIVYTAQNRSSDKKKKNKVAEEKPVPKPQSQTSVTPAPAKATATGISDEIVAVIAAAVDSTYGVGKARITGIKKSVSAGRPVWGQVGVVDNTKPF